MFSDLTDIGCNMSIQEHYLNDHLARFHEDVADYSKK